MKLGLITPVLSRFPGAYGAWEPDGTIDDVVRIAQGAERLGYECLTCAEHIAIPAETAQGQEGPGTCYWDPLATFGYLAAHTSRIRLATVVLPLPYHHPLDIAKRYGTLDRISGGRLILGVGVGYLKPEFALLGATYEKRNERSDDAIRALRASFGRPQPEYDGEHFQFRGMIIDPCGVQDQVPIWVGGRTRRSLRRAVELGDAWYPFAVTPGQVADWISESRSTEAWQQRKTPLEIVLAARLDPLRAPEDTARTIQELGQAGAGTLMVRFVHRSLDQYLEQLEAMVDVVSAL
jgi:probable F420-dependent oxidoreductase